MITTTIKISTIIFLNIFNTHTLYSFFTIIFLNIFNTHTLYSFFRTIIYAFIIVIIIYLLPSTFPTFFAVDLQTLIRRSSNPQCSSSSSSSSAPPPLPPRTPSSTSSKLMASPSGSYRGPSCASTWTPRVASSSFSRVPAAPSLRTRSTTMPTCRAPSATGRLGTSKGSPHRSSSSGSPLKGYAWTSPAPALYTSTWGPSGSSSSCRFSTRRPCARRTKRMLKWNYNISVALMLQKGPSCENCICLDI